MSVHDHASPFDDWVEEAPFRHLGIFVLVLLAAVALLCGCSGPPGPTCKRYEKHTYVTHERVSTFEGDGEKVTTTVLDECVETNI